MNIEKIKKFGTLQDEVAERFDGAVQLVGFDQDGTWVHNPFMDSTGRFAVDPVAEYGWAALRFFKGHIEVIENAFSKTVEELKAEELYDYLNERSKSSALEDLTQFPFTEQIYLSYLEDLDESKITDRAMVDCIWDGTGIYVDFNYDVDAYDGIGDYQLCLAETYLDGKPSEDMWRAAMALAEYVRAKYQIPLEVSYDEHARFPHMADAKDLGQVKFHLFENHRDKALNEKLSVEEIIENAKELASEGQMNIAQNIDKDKNLRKDNVEGAAIGEMKSESIDVSEER